MRPYHTRTFRKLDIETYILSAEPVILYRSLADIYFAFLLTRSKLFLPVLIISLHLKKKHY